MTPETKIIIALVGVGIIILSSIITVFVVTMGPALKDMFEFKKKRQIKKQLQAIINERRTGEINHE